jgi:hypothetical protein
LTGVEEYENWLTRHVTKNHSKKSVVSEKKVYLLDGKTFETQESNGFSPVYTEAEKCYINITEAPELGNKKLEISEIENLAMESIGQEIKKIRYTCFEIRQGPEYGPENVHIYLWSSNCHEGSYYSYSKNCAYCFFPRECENCFGSQQLYQSSFSIKCYGSTKLIRCFEVAESNNCRDCYFCYNSENLEECMFCFNTKSKKYAVGNVEIGKEAYLKLKRTIIDKIANSLEKNKTLKWDIYNIGCTEKVNK